MLSASRLPADGLALRSEASWSQAAAALLADLGFTLIDSQRPGTGGSHLLAAFRDTPTRRHFDPELVRCYTPSGSRAAVTIVDRANALAAPERRVLWGHVHVVDRLAVENRFLTFGGRLRVARAAADLHVLDLWSPGPIVRWGGHSQGADRLAGEIGAFFGRLIVPVDFTPGAEARIDAASPATIYAAFLIDLGVRLAASRLHLRGEPDTLEMWLSAERARLRSDAVAWTAAETLLADLRLTPGR